MSHAPPIAHARAWKLESRPAAEIRHRISTAALHHLPLYSSPRRGGGEGATLAVLSRSYPPCSSSDASPAYSASASYAGCCSYSVFTRSRSLPARNVIDIDGFRFLRLNVV
jgi:hypothetical protein